MEFLKRFFKIEENNTSVRLEIYTGLISFLAISYILAVNPSILGYAGMDAGGVFYATALAAFMGTLCMALYANYPLILAPSMGLNAFFAFTVVGEMGYSWQQALIAIVVEGVIFFLLSITSIRKKIIVSIPLPLKYAMGAGVGLFITLIALKSSYIIKADPDTLLTIQTFSGPTFHTAGISAVLALTGVLLTAYLMHRKVMGALLFGILGTWILGIICELTGLYHVQEGFPSLLPHFNLNAFTQPFHSFCDLFGSAFDVEQWHHKSSGNSGWNLLFSVDFMIICFAFLFTDFFDTIGTTSGAVANTPLMKENGDIPRLNKILLADSAATFFGGILGTSTTTTFAESAVGISAGARTGLAGLTAAILFLVSLICAPVFLAIPGFATAPALIIVGFLMIKSITKIDWDDITNAIPAYMLLIGIAFTYNISNGLGLGIIFYTILNCRIKGRINWVLWFISALFIIKYVCS